MGRFFSLFLLSFLLRNSVVGVVEGVSNEFFFFFFAFGL